VPLPSTGLYLIAFPYRRLSGLVRPRCFRSKGALTRRDARLVSVTHQTRLCQKRLRDSPGMFAIGTKRTFTRSPREVWFRPKSGHLIGVWNVRSSPIARFLGLKDGVQLLRATMKLSALRL
jgi:hypothetical protein